jgi:hypothetical protein
MNGVAISMEYRYPFQYYDFISVAYIYPAIGLLDYMVDTVLFF